MESVEEREKLNAEASKIMEYLMKAPDWEEQVRTARPFREILAEMEANDKVK